MTDRLKLDHVAIVLHRPRYPENIGAVARAMRNMGLNSLLLVEPRDFDLEKALKLSTHEAADLVHQAQIFDDLKAALAPFHYVVGTTARLGKHRQIVHLPATMAQKLIPISHKNRIAILFGPEDRGLTNEDIRNCYMLVNIPTADFSSLNLAQAVMIIAYELNCVQREDASPSAPRLATQHELNGMYSQLLDILVRISYLNPENPDYWMDKVRQFLRRLNLRAREVSIIRGLCRQVSWYGKKSFEDGRTAAIGNGLSDLTDETELKE
jgi:tRNA/rRNA methyltransferase